LITSISVGSYASMLRLLIDGLDPMVLSAVLIASVEGLPSLSNLSFVASRDAALSVTG